MKILRQSAFLGVAMLATACTTMGPTQTAATSNDCFFARSLSDWRPLDDQNLILFARGRQAYHVQLVRPAFGIGYDVMIGVSDRDGSICPYGGDAIIVDGPMPDRISIRSIRKLSDVQLEQIYVEFGIKAPAIVSETALDTE